MRYQRYEASSDPLLSGCRHTCGGRPVVPSCAKNSLVGSGRVCGTTPDSAVHDTAGTSKLIPILTSCASKLQPFRRYSCLLQVDDFVCIGRGFDALCQCVTRSLLRFGDTA